jgi:hypothetical protein
MFAIAEHDAKAIGNETLSALLSERRNLTSKKNYLNYKLKSTSAQTEGDGVA